MTNDFTTLFNQFDRGRLSRRHLLQALGIAVALQPASAFAQGQCGGAQGHARMQHHAREASLRADRLEDRDARSLLLPVRRLREGSGLLPRADELEDSQRRRQAGGARYRRLGRTRAARRLCGAAGACPRRRSAPRCRCSGGARPRRPGRCAARAAQRRVRRHVLGHRQVGCEEGRSGVEGARPLAGRRQSRRLPELPREGSRRLRSVDHQRQSQESPQGRRPAARRRRRRRSSRPAGRPCGSITSRSK